MEHGPPASGAALANVGKVDAGNTELTFTNLEELEGLARGVLPKMVYGYYASGAESEASVKENRMAYTRYRLLPRVLVDVSRVDTSSTILGHKLPIPIIIAPMAMQRMANPEGELAVGRAAAAEGFGMGVSTMGTCGLAEVADAARGAALLIFQLYVIKDRDFTRDLLQKAEAVGYQALCVTVDAPFLGRREADIRDNFRLPEGLELVNLLPLAQKGALPESLHQESGGSGIANTFVSHIDPSLTWEFMKWLRSNTVLPILVKGVLDPADAERALEAGVEGIVVSNHGGRQLDFSPSPLDMLPAIARVVNGRVPILVDGGIRRGTDVIKALALGADAVMVGRPILYALALGGEAGVRRALGILRSELELAMALAGRPTLPAITRSLLIGPGEDLSRL